MPARPMTPWFLFAPGAGAPSTSPWMENWRARLARVGPVITFDYPYRRAGRSRPDPLPTLITAHSAALEQARATTSGAAWLVGKSMGSRIGCHVSISHACAGAVCFGYPLVSQSGARRHEALLECPVPLLLIQGTRDKLCPLEELREVIRHRIAPTHLITVASGDHSLELTRSHLRAIDQTQDEIDGAICAGIEAFVSNDSRENYAEHELASPKTT